MIRIGQQILKKIRNSWLAFDRAARQEAVGIIEWETIEMENIFGLLVLGVFLGMPSPPMQITLDLLPEMEKHFILMLQKVDTASTALSELSSILEVG